MTDRPADTAATPASEFDSILHHRLDNGRTVEEELRQFEQLAKLLDTRFSLFGVRFGVDSVLGLIPVAGDITTGAAGLYALGHAFRLDLPKRAKAHIVWNILFDTALGSIPVVGDIFDFFFKSNTKNFKVVEKHLRKKAERQARERQKAQERGAREIAQAPPPSGHAAP